MSRYVVTSRKLAIHKFYSYKLNKEAVEKLKMNILAASLLLLGLLVYPGCSQITPEVEDKMPPGTNIVRACYVE